MMKQKQHRQRNHTYTTYVVINNKHIKIIIIIHTGALFLQNTIRIYSFIAINADEKSKQQQQRIHNEIKKIIRYS
jgi:hypothetical protein